MKYTSLPEIKAAYQRGELRSQAAAVAVARLFDCLRHLYPDSYDTVQWTPSQLAATSRKMSTGEAECAKFVIMVYNYHPMTNPKAHTHSGWKCGLFNIAEAVSHWGEDEKRVLTDWINSPLFL